MSVAAFNNQRVVIEEGTRGIIFDMLTGGSMSIYVREQVTSAKGGTETNGVGITIRPHDARRVQQWMTERAQDGPPVWEVKHAADGPRLYVDGALTALGYYQTKHTLDLIKPFPERMPSEEIGKAVACLMASARAPLP